MVSERVMMALWFGVVFFASPTHNNSVDVDVEERCAYTPVHAGPLISSLASIAGLEGRYFTNLNFYHLKYFSYGIQLSQSDIPTSPHATRPRTVCGMLHGLVLISS